MFCVQNASNGNFVLTQCCQPGHLAVTRAAKHRVVHELSPLFSIPNIVLFLLMCYMSCLLRHKGLAFHVPRKHNAIVNSLISGSRSLFFLLFCKLDVSLLGLTSATAFLRLVLFCNGVHMLQRESSLVTTED